MGLCFSKPKLLEQGSQVPNPQPKVNSLSQSNPNEKKPDKILENNEKKTEKPNSQANPTQNPSNAKSDGLSNKKEDQRANGDSNLGKSGLDKMKSQDPEDLGEDAPTTWLVNQKNKEAKNKNLVLE